MSEAIIEIRNLVKIYELSEEIQVKALSDVSLQIMKGEFVAIMGASGSGKSTLMNVLGFLDTPSSGIYLLDGIDGSQLDHDRKAEIRNTKIGFVFQGFNLLSRTSALENVELPMLYHGGVSSQEVRARAKKKLAMVGLSGREKHHPNHLSGGEQQRVAIARSLINEPTIILADEPTGNLDTRNTAEIMSLFTRLNKDLEITIIIVTHEPEVADYTQRRLQFSDGELVYDSANKKLGGRKVFKKK